MPRRFLCFFCIFYPPTFRHLTGRLEFVTPQAKYLYIVRRTPKPSKIRIPPFCLPHRYRRRRRSRHHYWRSVISLRILFRHFPPTPRTLSPSSPCLCRLLRLLLLYTVPRPRLSSSPDENTRCSLCWICRCSSCPTGADSSGCHVVPTWLS